MVGVEYAIPHIKIQAVIAVYQLVMHVVVGGGNPSPLNPVAKAVIGVNFMGQMANGTLGGRYGEYNN